MIDTQPAEQPKRRGRPSNGVRLQKIQAVTKTVQSNPLMSVREIAETAGVAKSTAQQYLAKLGINKTELSLYQEAQPDVLLDLAKRIGESIDDECIQKASLKDRIVSTGIVIDKFRLITGQSTSNIASWVNVVSQSHKAQVIDNDRVAHSTAECDKGDRSDD